MFAHLKFTAAAAAVAAMGTAAQAQDQTFITIGTGGVTGVYYPTGGAICRLVNKDRKEHNVRCSVESTGGSVYNTRTIRNGELDFGVVQSDVQTAAMEGARAFDGDEPYGDLRSVFSIHPEPLHVMVRAGTGISSVADMKGKAVNIGNPGSGTRALADVLMAANEITPGDLGLAAELKSSEQAAALCDGNIDAAIWAAGLPNGSTMEATSPEHRAARTHDLRCPARGSGRGAARRRQGSAGRAAGLGRNCRLHRLSGAILRPQLVGRRAQWRLDGGGLCQHVARRRGDRSDEIALCRGQRSRGACGADQWFHHHRPDRQPRLPGA